MLCFSLGAAMLFVALPCSAQGRFDGTYSGQYTGTIVQGAKASPPLEWFNSSWPTMWAR
jgi:hypothetical protein